MNDLLKFIELGTDCKEWFDYGGDSLPIRPLSTYEYDQIKLKIYEEGISEPVFKKIIQTRLSVFQKPESEQQEITLPFYKEYLQFSNEVDYWMVYYAMKDFQPEEFTSPDFNGEFEDDFDDWEMKKPKGYYIVRKMKYIHQIARDVKTMTNQPVIELKSILRNTKGKILASRTYAYHIPLVSEAWKLTPLQEKFLFYSRPGSPKVVSEEEVPGVKGGTLRETLEQLKKAGFVNG